MIRMSNGPHVPRYSPILTTAMMTAATTISISSMKPSSLSTAIIQLNSLIMMSSLISTLTNYSTTSKTTSLPSMILMMIYYLRRRPQSRSPVPCIPQRILHTLYTNPCHTPRYPTSRIFPMSSYNLYSMSASCTNDVILGRL
jgi:hypothetical protein